MSIRYTLRLETDGAEVWKRWTGDEMEAIRDVSEALRDMHLDLPRIRRFAEKVTSLIADVPNMQPGDQRGVAVLDQTLTTELSFDVRKSQGTVTQTTGAG